MTAGAATRKLTILLRTDRPICNALSVTDAAGATKVPPVCVDSKARSTDLPSLAQGPIEAMLPCPPRGYAAARHGVGPNPDAVRADRNQSVKIGSEDGGMPGIQ